jgi:hypothetical protein
LTTLPHYLVTHTTGMTHVQVSRIQICSVAIWSNLVAFCCRVTNIPITILVSFHLHLSATEWHFLSCQFLMGVGYAVAQCATSRKVAGSIPNGVFEIFYWHNPSGRTMALGLTQPLTENSSRNISWGEGGVKADHPTTFICRLSWTPGASTSWNPQGLSRPAMGLLYFALSLVFYADDLAPPPTQSLENHPLSALWCGLITIILAACIHKRSLRLVWLTTDHPPTF